jgi:N utilization substance protein A
MYLLKKNVPEIEEGIIEVKKLARIPGVRSKIAVASTNSASGIQPIGTIIGPGGSRINAIKQELDGERIDVIQYSADLKTFISNICFPVRIAGVKITDKMISIVCDDTPVQVRDRMVNNYMSLLGMRGNNISLIGKLLERPVELITPAVAAEIEIEYEPIDYSNVGSRGPRNDNRPQTFTSHEKKRVDLGTEEFDELFSNE